MIIIEKSSRGHWTIKDNGRHFPTLEAAMRDIFYERGIRKYEVSDDQTKVFALTNGVNK